MSSDPNEQRQPVAEVDASPPRGRRRSNAGRNVLLVIVAVVVLDLVAAIVVPPFPKGGTAGQACAFPVCYINGNLEFPAPHQVIDLDPADPLPSGQLVIAFHPSITSTLLTMWIVELIVLAIAVVGARNLRLVPGRLQNILEFTYESLENFAVGIGGELARPHVWIYAAFFLLILACNWSGLIPPVGKLDELRAPTSDVNVTIGLALVSFSYFELQGFKANGVRGYLGKFFPLGEFRNGIGAGLIAMFVGLIELMLEFVKPVTLSMRLFGNIYGGEVALGVLTGLTVAVVPVMMFFLEGILTFVQALIFSVLTLIFTTIAVETHHEADDAAHAAPGQPEPAETVPGAHPATA